MFEAIESAIVNRITGVIPDAPVFTTFDVVDFSEEGAPRLAAQIRWMGFVPGSQNSGAAEIQHRFEVSILIDAARARPDQRAAASVGLGQMVARLIGFQVDLGRRMVLAGETPPPDFDGFALRISAYFNVTSVINAVK